MIDTRERAYAQRLPRVDALLATGAAQKLAQRRDELEGRLNTIESAQDVAALGSPLERSQWERIQRVEAALANAPAGVDRTEQRDRLRLVKGVLYFHLAESFKARTWQQRRTMKDLDLALRETQSRWIRVERARKSVPTNTGEFAARVAALKARIDALQVRLAATEQKQSAYLAQLAVAELERQKDRLATYQVQARFALATMYDRAANTETAHAPRPAPAGEGETAPTEPTRGDQQPVPMQQPQPTDRSPRDAAPPSEPK
jgi:hypothetical protein